MFILIFTLYNVFMYCNITHKRKIYIYFLKFLTHLF